MADERLKVPSCWSISLLLMPVPFRDVEEVQWRSVIVEQVVLKSSQNPSYCSSVPLPSRFSGSVRAFFLSSSDASHAKYISGVRETGKYPRDSFDQVEHENVLMCVVRIRIR